ncbi:MAG: GTPase [archaeon]
MQFYSIETPEKLIEAAFGHARKNDNVKRTRLSAVQHRKEKVVHKMETFTDYLDKQMNHMIISVPRFDELHPFYQELLPETMNVGAIKQSVSQMVSVRKLLRKQFMQGKRAIYQPAGDSIEHMKKESARFFGRSASIVKSLKKSIDILRTANQMMKEVPDVRVDIPTLILAGFPNTGKTTLLKRLTGSKAQIAAYPFTTKSIQLGYFSMRYREVQVVDTPGLLDRVDEKWNPIEKKARAALKHLATAIVFVIDPTLSSGYSLEKQKLLLDRLKSDFSIPFILVFNKTDIATSEMMENAHAIFGVDTIREGEGVESNLKDHVWRALGFGR